MNTEPHVFHLLWTGGWDSTFRLLQLLIIQNMNVVPHYLIDVDRRSTYQELCTIRKIKKEIYTRFPNTREKLYPTKIFDIGDLPSNLAISESFLHIKRNFHLGSQYDWLARYCLWEGARHFELGVTSRGHVSQIIEPLLTCSGEGDTIIYQLDERYKGTDEYNLFGWYQFPLLYLSKKDMQKIAWEEGLQDIMKMTWFCHHPGPRNIPCGLCGPCSIAIEKGFGWRIPRANRFKYYLLKNIKRYYHPNQKKNETY